jgi:hypothetical protein
MQARHRPLAAALSLSALALLAVPADAGARPGGQGTGFRSGGHVHHAPAFQAGYRSGYHRGHSGHGRFWGGIGIGLGLGLGSVYLGAPWYPAPWYPAPWYPGYVTAVPAPAYPVVAPEPAAKAPPEPIIYPRADQSPAQTEADRRACDRWAMTQPSAMADASIFHRATLACMEGRGYTVR